MISVVLPIYNVSQYIEACVQSLINQSYSDFQIVLVDDGGSDNSVILAEGLLSSAGVPFLTVAKKDEAGHVENRGLSAARNLGIEAAHGEWVICLDSDDCLHPNALETYASCISHCPEVDFISSDFIRVKESPYEFDALAYNESDISLLSREQMSEAFLYRSIQLICPSIMAKKSHLIEHGLFYPEGCRFSEDQYFNWRLIAYSNYSARINCPLYYYVNHDNSIMTSSGLPSFYSGWEWILKLGDELAVLDSLAFDSEVIINRWLLGALHSAARLLDFNEFSEFLEYSKARRRIKPAHFSEPRSIVAAGAVSILPASILHWLLRRA